MSPELPGEAVTPCVGYSQVSPSGAGGRELGGGKCTVTSQILTSSGQI